MVVDHGTRSLQLTEDGIDISDDPFLYLEDVIAGEDVYYEDDEQIVIWPIQEEITGYGEPIKKWAERLDMTYLDLVVAVDRAAREAPDVGCILTFDK